MNFNPISFGIGYFFGVVTVVLAVVALLAIVAWERNTGDGGDGDGS